MNYALLMSGGVDSALACHFMVEAGLRPDLFYIKIGMQGEDTTCTAEEDLELCQLTARRYALQLHTVDLQQAYHDSVTAYLVDRVRRGLTPNPDIMCNRLIKFGAFHQAAGHAYDRIATGHYAQVLREPDGQLWLAPSPDPVKDQSDFLSQTYDWQVRKMLFPIGHLHKAEVRRQAELLQLPAAHRRDSQGLCFLGRIHYRAGASYATSYQKINGLDGPKELSVSAGFGIPIMNGWNNRSILNISGQWVHQSAKSLITENTFRINIGLTFNERWFMKWKVE